MIINFQLDRGSSSSKFDPDDQVVTFESPNTVDPPFGLKRDDSDEVLIESGDVNLTRLGEGVYQHVFDDPSPGLNYTYWLKYTIDGADQYQEFHAAGDDVQLGDISGTYADINDLYNEYGQDNVRGWCVLDGSVTDGLANDVVRNRVQHFFNFADSEINQALVKAGYTVPLSGTSEIDDELLKDIAVKLIGPQLSKGRPDRDASQIGDEDNPEDFWWARDTKFSRSKLGLIAAKLIILSATKGTVALAGYKHSVGPNGETN